MAGEPRVHPLDGVRMGPKLHPAPAFPQVEQQFAPSCFVRVPDSPLMQPGQPPYENRRQNWAIGPGWVVAHKMVAYVLNEPPSAVPGTWSPATPLQSFVDVQLEINSHDQRYTNSEARAWHSIALAHQGTQGWVPWIVRVKPGDIWAWSYRYRGLLDDNVRIEIGLQFVLDSDLAYPIGTHKPNPQGAVALARTIPSRWLIPPEPYTSLPAAEQSAPRRIDFQMGAGALIAWSGSAFQQDERTAYQQAGPHVDSTVEVSASFNDGEHLITNGSGPDWLSLHMLFGGRGGRRFQPLCRKVSHDDTLAVSFRNVGRVTVPPMVPIQPEVCFGWSRDLDPTVAEG
jgi:hypothetical protein